MFSPSPRGVRGVLQTVLLTAALAVAAAAQPPTVLANVEVGPKRPVALVQVLEGSFYSVSGASSGGTGGGGVVFRIQP